jgi:hypothetical protein
MFIPQQRIHRDSFYEELERIFDKFPKYHINILLDFSAKVGREDVYKFTTGNKSIREIINDNRVTVVNFSTSKSLTVKSTVANQT